ncbi:GFA family protein [Rhodobacter sp. KR11]|uniref:GFA family protein n=1 Tax=Rhodobacter sp. KR11 TaxID=2974588 RepID=UPI002223A213|nr:GFA family protein [Rhodobacter sp. KR11]MCW1918766.1 GFA family protein [Rhodobacter sp. KR11]
MRGACLCGGVAFTVTGPLRPVIACHCTQCRKQSGHYWAATSVPVTHLQMDRAETLRWYQASPSARRGFCGGCGAFLFWQEQGSASMSLAAGALEGPTGLRIAEHWFHEDGGDYYTTPRAATKVHGACLCGANRFTVPHAAGAVWACHCSQCRKTSGHYSASFDAEQIDWQARSVARHVGPNGGLREFCPTCGSGLTFTKGGVTSVEAGVCEGATGGHLAGHVFAGDRGDYYALDDGLPQSDQDDLS